MVAAFINLDFADVRSIMKDAGYAHMGVGSAKGVNKAEDAGQRGHFQPAFGDEHLRRARRYHQHHLLAGHWPGRCGKAASLITNSAHPEANIIWGAAFDENLKDEMSITVIATGFDAGLVGSDPMDVPQNAATFGGKVQVAFKNDTAPVAPAQPVQPVAPTQPVQPAPAVEEDDNSYFDDILGLLNNRGNN